MYYSKNSLKYRDFQTKYSKTKKKKKMSENISFFFYKILFYLQFFHRSFLYMLGNSQILNYCYIVYSNCIKFVSIFRMKLLGFNLMNLNHWHQSTNSNWTNGPPLCQVARFGTPVNVKYLNYLNYTFLRRLSVSVGNSLICVLWYCNYIIHLTLYDTSEAVFTSTREVKFLGVFICRIVCVQDYSKTSEHI